MQVSDLELNELLDLSPRGGVIRFAGRRALLLDAESMGLLRTELVETLGSTAARGILTRLGFMHGWRTAESLKHDFPWDDEAQWRRAGGRLHTLQGLVTVEAAPPREGPPPWGEAIWRDSFEAEQHLLHQGRSDAPVCWMLCGFASGYASFVTGREVYFFEEHCLGCGDSTCHVVGRYREEWSGGPFADELAFYRKGCLEATMNALTETLKKTEAKLRKKRTELARTAPPDVDPSGLIARSEVMQKLLATARRVARVDSTVLIIGESGAGKERLAQLVHEHSPREGGPFVAVNCAAVTESLLESELFGHAKGAFTGATSDRPGLFEAAHGGTLFLDEVGEVPPAMQAKLLRVIQEREVRRVGENKPRAVDVRLVAATNRDLAAEVTAGTFRKDLYYRLRVVELRVPPLRERKEDVLPLARVLLARSAAQMGRKITGLAAKAADQLLRYDWPGNVRELENAMERAAALAESDRIGVDDLPEEIRAAPPVPLPVGEVRRLAEVERDYILAALEANGGNQTRTASQLGIGTATLYRKLKTYGRLQSQA